MLTILNDPAGATGRQRHAWDYSLTIQANVERWLSAGGDARVLLNGAPIDPAADPAMDRLPTVADHLTVIRRPAGFDPFSWTALAIYAAVAAVAMVALMPRPTFDANAGKDSPNNRLTGQSNVARAYQAIPDVYGYRRVWPDLIQPSTVQYVDHVKYVTEWLCVSRGHGDITAVQYADTPISDIAGASFEVFQPVPGGDGYPEHGTTTLEDVLETFESPEVNGQELPYANPFPTVTASGTLTADAGATTCTVTVPDSDDLAALKLAAISGTGVAHVSLIAGGITTIVNADCTVVSAVVSGGSCTFTFTFAAEFADAHDAESVTASMTAGDVETTTIGPFTLPIDCDRLRWNITAPRGLKGISLTVGVTWWRIDADGVEIAGTRQSREDEFYADTYDARYWTLDATPTGGYGRYRIEFTRLDPQYDDNGGDLVKLEEVYAVRHYATKVLPGVTVIRVTTRATEQATGFSDRKFNLRWARHVRPLGAGALSASRNFARTMAHIWTLAGGDIAELDTDALAAINTAMGEDSPLLRFDGSLDDADMSLGERLQLVANHARCVLWRDGTRWTVTRDQARQYPELQLDYRNLAAAGDSAISYAAHLPASHDGVELEYVDEATQSKKAYIRLNISSGAVVESTASNPSKIQLAGCTSTTQAMNRAQLEARRLLYSRVSVQDTALADAGSLGLGALVRWIDPADFDGQDDGLQAGEVLAVAGDVIATSELLTWGDAAVGRMLLTGTDGQRLGAPVLCYPDAAGVRLASVPAGLYVADGATTQCGSRYAFATGLTDAELEAAGLYTVTSVKPSGDGTASVALSQYDSRTYGYDDE